MPATPRAVELARAAADAAADKGGTDLLLLDVSEQLLLTDVFLLCSGATDRQVGAVVDGVLHRMRDEGVRPQRREGQSEMRWVLLDLGDVVVHVMDVEERAYYRLESLWKDCPEIAWEHAGAALSPRGRSERGDDTSALPTAVGE